MSYYNRTRPVSQPAPTYYNRTRQASYLLPNKKIITETKLSDIAETKLNEIMKHLTDADKSKEENTILDKINFFAYIEESSSTITTCEICYELYKIVYNYIKKYIRKNHKEYPKFTKEEYLKILEQTYKLKLENCRNKFNITSMISTKSSSSSLSSLSSHSPPKAKKQITGYQNFVREHMAYLRQKEAEGGVKTTASEKMQHIGELWRNYHKKSNWNIIY